MVAFSRIEKSRRASLIVGMILLGAVAAQGAMDPRFELDPQALEGIRGPAKAAPRADRRAPRPRPRSASGDTQGTTYTVKQGDHLFRILMRDYGLSNDEAEAFIDEIRRVNNIYDIKRLKVGQKITIPPVRRKADGSLRSVKLQKVEKDEEFAAGGGQTLRLQAPDPQAEQQAVAQVKEVWDKLVPPREAVQKPLVLQSSAFSLTLDPQRYPVMTAWDGAKILVDQGATLPPLVRSLITEKDPSVRIVSESPGSGRRFLGAMLQSAGFYSVEENFSMEFGTDPKLTVRSDFKIEKSPDSVVKQDVVLLNSGRTPLPPVLIPFLKKEGFTYLEPFATAKPFMGRTPLRQLQQISTKSQPETIDAILKALSLPYDTDRRVDVFAADNNGISLSVKAERYFEREGRRFVVTRFDGDPVTYTLFRILETKGYRVVMVEGQDDFRKIAQKIISRLRLQGVFGQHSLWGDEGEYSLQMSGFNLVGPGVPGGSLFLTDREIDRIVRDLMVENGYQINGK